ncbi:MAG: polymerase subunit delta [Verrucomicrobiota bacterium]|jgi:DNA polymerase-3 subunit delta
MAATKTSKTAATSWAGDGPKPLSLICGDDDFAVKQRARALFQQWSEELGGMDHEIVDARVNTVDEALKALAKLREALNTLPFFGGAKAIWLKDCSFLGDERTATSMSVTETLSEIGDELKAFDWRGIRLLISAGKVDKRRAFYKALEKLGEVELFAAWSIDDKNWAAEAESTASRALRARKKTITDEALAGLVNAVGPQAQQLANEVEKLSLYTGDRIEIVLADVDAIVTRNKHARAFAVAEAFGDRQLSKLLRTLDEELWAMKFDKKRSEIGLLYGVISKARILLLLKEMIREGWIRPGRNLKEQLEGIPPGQLPDDKKFNPLSIHPFVLQKALAQVENYSTQELVAAMSSLLDCNRRLVSSGLDEALVLQQTLVQIVRRDEKTSR